MFMKRQPLTSGTWSEHHCFKPCLEELESRQLPSASVLNLPADFGHLLADSPKVLTAPLIAIQGSVYTGVGKVSGSYALMQKGSDLLNQAVAEKQQIMDDYQKIKDDLDVVNNIQTGTSQLPPMQRGAGDALELMLGGFGYSLGSLGGDKELKDNSMNLMKNAVNDVGKMLQDTVGNLYNSAGLSSQTTGTESNTPSQQLILNENAPPSQRIIYNENAPRLP